MQAKQGFVTRSEVIRRNKSAKKQFPQELDSGEVVLRDRRLTPDRRKDGIKTEEIQISAEEFEELFQAFGC